MAWVVHRLMVYCLVLVELCLVLCCPPPPASQWSSPFLETQGATPTLPPPHSLAAGARIGSRPSKWLTTSSVGITSPRSISMSSRFTMCMI